MAQYTFNEMIGANVAPMAAKFIGVYNSNGERVGEVPLGSLQNTRTTQPLYKFGLLSDVHTDATDYQYVMQGTSYDYNGDEAEGDLKRALGWFRDVEHVNLICCCGDMSQGGTDSEFEISSGHIANEIPNIPFYTCTGNHDVSGNSHTGAATFMNYFNNRTIDTSSYSLQISSAYTNSFYFTKSYTVSGQSKTDVFMFLSQYYYSNSTVGQYLAADLAWANGILSQHTNDRVFIFKHLFFPSYSGNLNGIYPTNNILNGSALTTFNTMLSTYPNAYWFNGHSHWKWYLQKYQQTANVARYGNNGAWAIHVPSCALPIDSNGTSTRNRKPLESQGAVVDVYADGIVLRGIDFNINTSQNGDTTQGFSASTYTTYQPIAIYDLRLS